MLMSNNFKKVEKSEDGNYYFTRKGASKNVRVPESLHNTYFHDINIDEETGDIYFAPGEDVYVLTDHFGVMCGKDTQITVEMFFVDGGVCLKIAAGRVYLRGDNGTIISLDPDGDLVYHSDISDGKIAWMTHENVYNNARYTVIARFGLGGKPQSLVDSYLDNLGMDGFFQYVNLGHPAGCFLSMKFTNLFSDFGLGVFEFTEYKTYTSLEGEDDETSIGPDYSLFSSDGDEEDDGEFEEDEDFTDTDSEDEEDEEFEDE
ncbi:hypothetical protein D3C71_1314130 [compost metagenome]